MRRKRSDDDLLVLRGIAVLLAARPEALSSMLNGAARLLAESLAGETSA